MDFSLSEEQSVFKASVERFMQEHYDLEKRMAYLAFPEGYSAGNWTTLAELGLLSLPFSEELGGLGGGQADLMVVMEAFGVGPLVEPFLSTVLMSGHLIELLGSDAQKDFYIEKIMAGEHRMSLAYSDPNGRFNLSYQTATATLSEEGYVIDGQKTLVLGSDFATDSFIVLARTQGDVASKEGLTLFIVPKGAQGLTTKDYKLVDGTSAMTLTFENVTIDENAVLGSAHEGYAAVETTLARASLAICSEAIGLMENLFQLTLEYLKTRTQFGRPIGSFQALQHRMAEHYVSLEQAKSIVMRAVATSDIDHNLWLKEIYGAKAFVSEAAMSLGQDAIQLHGGMGTTDELIISHYHKRLLFIQNLFGDASHHYRLCQLAAE